MCLKNGIIFRFYKNQWKKVENTANHSGGYNTITLNKKMFKRHRIIAYALLNLDIDNKTLHIDHIDGDKLNNQISNLRIVNHQQNHFNRKTAKGYYYNKQNKKWQAHIILNYKKNHLGYFLTEEEARQAYLNAKLIYHKIE